MDVAIPLINVRVKVFLPTNGDRRPLTRDRVIDLCQNSTDNVEGLANLREEHVVQKHRKLELCWRTETKLDWVWLDNDTEGKQRDDAVCYGIALQDVSFDTCVFKGSLADCCNSHTFLQLLNFVPRSIIPHSSSRESLFD